MKNIGDYIVATYYFKFTTNHVKQCSLIGGKITLPVLNPLVARSADKIKSSQFYSRLHFHKWNIYDGSMTSNA